MSTQLLGPDFPGPGTDDLRDAYGDPTSFFGATMGADHPPATFRETDWRRAILSPQSVWFPTPIRLSGSKQPVSRVYPHKRLVDSLQAVFAELDKSGAWRHVTDYAGMYCYRLQRGGARPSMHSYAAAIDLNAERYPLGQHPNMADPFVLEVVPVFEAHGWTWGGRWQRPDAMHFQATAGA